MAAWDACVAPHAGAWIEISGWAAIGMWRAVAPHAGAWIEIGLPLLFFRISGSRSPCGSVD